MADLFLDSLEISNFRAFEHLKIERLGRVNLIVGKNSVGKTALLEALWLYANRGSLQIALEILKARNELNSQAISGNRIANEEAIIAALKNLFYNRKVLKNNKANIEIKSVFSPNNPVKIYIDSVKNITERNNLENSLRFNNIEELVIPDELGLLYVSDSSEGTDARLIDHGKNIDLIRFENHISNNFVRAGGLVESEASQLWNNIILTSLENSVIEALQIIIPEIERVAILNGTGNNFGHSILVRLKNEKDRVALRSLGDGLNRIFGIALALVNSKDGMLLVDEIENGLHFTVQLDLWRLIFAIARRLNVQVFATTHSWDCIDAFQKAANEDPELGMVIRLNNIDGEITSTAFDERRLAIVTREQIEVR